MAADTPTPEELRSWWRQQLVEGAERLALPYQAQRAWLDSLPVSIHHAGELGDGFSDFARFAPELRDHGLLSPLAAEKISSLEGFLVEMSGPSNAELWTFEALENNQRWREVRQRAADILGDINP